MTARRVALVAGGGTAGHVLPALAVARALEAFYGPGSVELVGSRRGVETSLLADAGLPATLLAGRGIARRLDPRTVAANAGAAAGLLWACAVALWIVLRRRPAVVVSVGGYASVPTSAAAVVCGVPLVLVNTDAVPGAANRLFAPLARACAVAHPGTALARAVVTGAPVRAEVLEARSLTTVEARRMLGLAPDGLVVACFGGSLGARRVNEAVLALAEAWSGRPATTLYHVVGRRDAPWAAQEAAARKLADGELRYVQVAYESRMPVLYRAADVAVCRAGAMTVAELAVMGLPAVLVPLPGAPGDHQTANARSLQTAGAAVLVEDAALDGDRLGDVLDGFAGDHSRLEAMADAALGRGRPDAAEAVAALAESHARVGRLPQPTEARR